MGPAIASKQSTLWPWAVASLAVHGLLFAGMLYLFPFAGPFADGEVHRVEVMLLPAPSTQGQTDIQHEVAQAETVDAKAQTEPESRSAETQEDNPETARKRHGLSIDKHLNNKELHKDLDAAHDFALRSKVRHELAAEARLKAQAVIPHPSDGASSAKMHVSAEAERNRSVRDRLERFKHYPASARRRGIEGAVDVSFRLNAEGRAEDMQLVSGSGYSILDDAALSTVRRAEPFPVHDGFYRFRLMFTRS